MKRPTILDVAALSGVSKSTVSRILNQGAAPGYGDSERKVREAAEALGYRRDVSAANLRLGKTGTVGVVLTYLTDVVRAMFFDEVVKACRAKGHFAIAAGVENDSGSDRVAVDLLLRQGVDALILTTTNTGDPIPAELAARDIPYVLALRSIAGSPSAVGDDELGGYLATRHLIELGHRSIALISGPVGTSTVGGRIIGYRRAMKEAGHEIRPEHIVPASFGAPAGGEAATRLMSLRHRPTAIFAVNDTTAIGAMSALMRLGFRVPEDVSLVGYSDIPIVQHLPVPLTTIQVPYGKIAADAVEMLFAQEHDAAQVRVSQPRLVVRSSTAGLVSG